MKREEASGKIASKVTDHAKRFEEITRQYLNDENKEDVLPSKAPLKGKFPRRNSYTGSVPPLRLCDSPTKLPNVDYKSHSMSGFNTTWENSTLNMDAVDRKTNYSFKKSPKTKVDSMACVSNTSFKFPNLNNFTSPSHSNQFSSAPSLLSKTSPKKCNSIKTHKHNPSSSTKQLSSTTYMDRNINNISMPPMLLPLPESVTNNGLNPHKKHCQFKSLTKLTKDHHSESKHEYNMSLPYLDPKQNVVSLQMLINKTKSKNSSDSPRMLNETGDNISETISTDIMTDKCLNWLDQYKSDNKSFIVEETEQLTTYRSSVCSFVKSERSNGKLSLTSESPIDSIKDNIPLNEQ